MLFSYIIYGYLNFLGYIYTIVTWQIIIQFLLEKCVTIDALGAVPNIKEQRYARGVYLWESAVPGTKIICNAVVMMQHIAYFIINYPVYTVFLAAFREIPTVRFWLLFAISLTAYIPTHCTLATFHTSNVCTYV